VTTARSRGMARGGSEGGEVNERKQGVGRSGLRHLVSLRGTGYQPNRRIQI
jgi:hypothetical protein